MINEQSVHQSYSLNHTAYQVIKYAQCYFEQKLLQSVKTTNQKINRSAKQRLLAKEQRYQEPTKKDSGVTRHNKVNQRDMLSYIPGVSSNVAFELSNLGKSFADIMKMSVTDLELIKGVGKVSAERIFEAFNVM
jgi:ERCC4-type nuclease